jgi:pyrroloquinoline-quinone synthase
MTTHPTLGPLIEAVLEESGYRENPYFRELASGGFSREDFLETQYQFYRVVTFFSRPMAALAAKIPTPELRLEVVRNLWEEHGEGDPARVHGTTFLELLARLRPEAPRPLAVALEERSQWPECRVFNTLLIGVCGLDEYLPGVGVMGIIERMFAEISAWIGRGIVTRGWLTEERMIHYSLHEELDLKHSGDFFAILEKSWDRSARARYEIEQGLRMGALAFNQLFDGLYRARARRAMREPPEAAR